MKLSKIKGLCTVIAALSVVTSAFSRSMTLTYTIVNKSQRDIIFALNTKCMSDSNYYNYILKPMETIQETLKAEGTRSCAFYNSEADISIDSTPGISAHNYHFSEPVGSRYGWDSMEIRDDTPIDIISAQENGSRSHQNIFFIINK